MALFDKVRLKRWEVSGVNSERERGGGLRDGECNPLSQVQFICWTIQRLNLLTSAGVRYIENYSISMQHSILWIQIYGPNTTPLLNSVV